MLYLDWLRQEFERLICTLHFEGVAASTVSWDARGFYSTVPGFENDYAAALGHGQALNIYTAERLSDDEAERRSSGRRVEQLCEMEEELYAYH